MKYESIYMQHDSGMCVMYRRHSVIEIDYFLVSEIKNIQDFVQNKSVTDWCTPSVP